MLKNWIYRPYSAGYLTKGLEALKEVCILFLYTAKSINDEEKFSEDLAPNQDSTNSNQNFASCSFYNYSQPSQQDSQNNEALVFQRDKAIDEEIDKFSKLLSDKKFVENVLKKNLRYLDGIYRIIIIIRTCREICLLFRSAIFIVKKVFNKT